MNAMPRVGTMLLIVFACVVVALGSLLACIIFGPWWLSLVWLAAFIAAAHVAYRKLHSYGGK